VSWLLNVSLILGLIGQAPPPGREQPDGPAGRLNIMKKSLAHIVVRSADEQGAAYSLRPEPVLRFTNTVGQSQDGSIFLWGDAVGRPAAAVQVFLRRDGGWYHELSSLSAGRLVAKSADIVEWRPSRAGVEFKPVPDAPRPAASAESRLRQIQAMARDFSASDEFRFESWQSLRLLSKPLARYGKPESRVTDGALFAFVLTTDPEAFLMIEAVAGTDGTEWRYAFAPMSIYPLKASYKGREVWSLEDRRGGDPNEPFHVRPFEPEN